MCSKENDRPRALTCFACRKKIRAEYIREWSKSEDKEKRKKIRLRHYKKKRGIPESESLRKRRKSHESTLNSDGYVLITRKGHPNQNLPGGRMLEHVFVMSESLGRPLVKGENVHHKNGDRSDNRIENLELWSTCQPKGQNVKDKLDFYISFIQKHGYKVTKE